MPKWGEFLWGEEKWGDGSFPPQFIGVGRSPNKLYILNYDLETWEAFSPQPAISAYSTRCVWGDFEGHIVIVLNQPGGLYSWHYDALTDAWTSEFVSSAPGTAPGDIQGLAHDDLYYADGKYVWHWDGASWSKDLTNTGSSGAIASLSISASDNIWLAAGAATHGIVHHWDGNSWLTISDPIFNYARCVSVHTFGPDDVFVGAYYNYDTTSKILHWNGTAWSVSHSGFLAARQIMYDFWGTDRENLFASGEYYYFGGEARAMKFNGSSWAAVPVDSPGSDMLQTIHGIATNTIIAASWDHQGFVRKYDLGTDTFKEMTGGLAAEPTWYDLSSYSPAPLDDVGPYLGVFTPSGIDVDPLSLIFLFINDDVSGVEQSSIAITVDGTSAVVAGVIQAGFDGAGSSVVPDGLGGVSVSLVPTASMDSAKEIVVNLYCTDVNSNALNTYRSFTVEDYLGPLVSPTDPQPSDTSISVDSHINVSVTDESGVVEGSVLVEVNLGTGYEVAYEQGGSPEFKPGYDGPSSLSTAVAGGYEITIDPVESFDLAATVLVRITAVDPAGNAGRLP